jgi:hypothetical protein
LCRDHQQKVRFRPQIPLVIKLAGGYREPGRARGRGRVAVLTR